MRKIYWYLLAYLKKHGLKAILVVAIGVGCFSLLLPLLQKNFAHRTTHYIAIIGEYDLHNLPPVVKDQLSLGLMEVDTDGSFLPALASELTIDSTGTRYVFSFNQEHYWHDGKIFSPADVVYPLQEVQVTASDTQLIYQLPAVSAAFPLSFPQSNLATRGKYNLSIESSAADGGISVPMHLIDAAVYRMQLSGSTSSPRTGEDILFNIISDSGRSS